MSGVQVAIVSSLLKLAHMLKLARKSAHICPSCTPLAAQVKRQKLAPAKPQQAPLPSLFELCCRQLGPARVAQARGIRQQCESACDAAEDEATEELSTSAEILRKDELEDERDDHETELDDELNGNLADLNSACDAEAAPLKAALERVESRRKTQAATLASKRDDDWLAWYERGGRREALDAATAAAELKERDWEKAKESKLQELRAGAAARRRETYARHFTELRYELRGDDERDHAICAFEDCRQTFAVADAKQCHVCAGAGASARENPWNGLRSAESNKTGAVIRIGEAAETSAGASEGGAKKLPPCSRKQSSTCIHPFFASHSEINYRHGCGWKKCPFCQEPLCRRHGTDVYAAPDFDWMPTGCRGEEIEEIVRPFSDMLHNHRSCPGLQLQLAKATTWSSTLIHVLISHSCPMTKDDGPPIIDWLRCRQRAIDAWSSVAKKCEARELPVGNGHSWATGHFQKIRRKIESAEKDGRGHVAVCFDLFKQRCGFRPEINMWGMTSDEQCGEIDFRHCGRVVGEEESRACVYCDRRCCPSCREPCEGGDGYGYTSNHFQTQKADRDQQVFYCLHCIYDKQPGEGCCNTARTASSQWRWFGD